MELSEVKFIPDAYLSFGALNVVKLGKVVDPPKAAITSPVSSSGALIPVKAVEP